MYLIAKILEDILFRELLSYLEKENKLQQPELFSSEMKYKNFAKKICFTTKVSIKKTHKYEEIFLIYLLI